MRACSRGTVRAAFVAFGVLTAISNRSHAQVAYDSPSGRVEVLGLRRWTLKMLQDSVRHYVPGQELHEAACMVTLRDSLGFADASVARFEWTPPGQPLRSFLTIKVVEPAQASQVQWDVRARSEFTSLLPDYAPLILPVTDARGDVLSGRIDNWLQFSDSGRRELALANAPSGARADADRVVEFRRSQRSEPSRQRAMRVLASDGFWVNRMAAVVVLSNFAQHNSTWRALVRALRDPNEGVREAARTVIGTFPPRPVDWRASSKDLRLLVGGTNLPAMGDLFSVLASTSISHDMAASILRDNGDWVLDHLASETPMASQAAHQLLVRLNAGRDLGRSREAWSIWIRSL